MNTVKEEAATSGCTQELLTELYKNLKMGADSIVNILPHAKEPQLKEELTAELNRYEELAADAGKLLYRSGETPEEKGMMAKMAAKMGMAVNTMMDSSSSHIAEMMIEGATMGITDTISLIRKYENKSCSEEALRLAKNSVRFMEDSVERMKKYL